MEGILGIALLVLGGLAGLFFAKGRAKKKEVRDKVVDAREEEKDGAIEASVEFAERIKIAEDAIDAAIDARPVTDDPVADLTDRVKRRRRRRRRQRAGSKKPADRG